MRQIRGIKVVVKITTLIIDDLYLLSHHALSAIVEVREINYAVHAKLFFGLKWFLKDEHAVIQTV